MRHEKTIEEFRAEAAVRRNLREARALTTPQSLPPAAGELVQMVEHVARRAIRRAKKVAR